MKLTKSKRMLKRASIGCLGLLLAGFGAAAAAEVCCPAGCVQEGAWCVRTGPTPTRCPAVACPAGGSGQAPGGGHSGTGSPMWTPPSPPNQPLSRPRVCKMKGDQPPPGSYSKTCPSRNFRCSQTEDKLVADCKDRKGRLKRSELPSASTCANVVNDDGRLVCRKQRRYVTEG